MCDRKGADVIWALQQAEQIMPARVEYCVLRLSLALQLNPPLA